MIVDPPPPKYVQIDDLVVGDEYWIDAATGGVHTVVYKGYYTTGYYGFKNKSDEWPDFLLAPERIIETIRVCYGVMTEDEWRAAGGKYPREV